MQNTRALARHDASSLSSFIGQSFLIFIFSIKIYTIKFYHEEFKIKSSKLV